MQQIVDQVCELEQGTRFSVVAPVVRGRKGEYGKLFEQFRADGFTRVKVDGEVRELEEDIELDKKFKHDVAVVVDRLVMKEGLRRRLTDSVETAAALADGLVDIELAGDDERTLTFSEKFACIHCGISLPEIEPRIFSFNTPHGACPACHGLGFTQEIDPDLVVPDGSISIDQGALLPYGQLSFGWLEQVFESIAKTFGVDTGVPWDDMSEEDRKLFLYGTGKERIPLSYRNYQGRMRHYNSSFPGIIKHLERRFVETESEQVRQKIEEYMADRPCPECHGARLKPTSLAVTVGERNIHEFTLLSVRESLAFLDGLSLSDTERLIGSRVIKEIGERLRFLNDVGVGYLSLQRASATLSGGEAQRIRLATQIGSALVGVLYILDEPSIGLHQRDNRRLIETLLRLRDLGNTVVVVEHDEETMRLADYIVDMGPGAGEHGGRVVAQGTPQEVMADAASLTGEYLSGRRRIELPGQRRMPLQWFTVRGARMHNLKDIDVSFPVGAFTCVTGVSGSGKSTLVNEILHKGMAARLNRGTKLRAGEHDGIDGAQHLDKVIDIDQSPIGRTPRSNPATYTGVFDHIRQLFAQTPESKLRGYKPGRFSFNVKGGRCETCKGDGQIKIEMHFLPDVYVPCEVCHGKRYNRDTLEVWYKGKNIAEVLEMSVEESRRVLRQRAAHRAPPQGARRGGPGLHQARPAGDHAVRRRGPAGQAGQRAEQDRHRQDALHPRRAHHRPALPGHRQAARDAPAAGRPGQHRGGHRAQPRRHQERRLGRRPRPRGRRRGRPGGRGRHARGACRPPRAVAHRRVPRALARRLGRPAPRPRPRLRRRRRPA